MALNNNKELYIKRTKQILIYGILLFLVIFNTIKFFDFTSSNPELLVEYKTPIDKLRHFKNPLIASVYFDNDDNIKILVLPQSAINHPFINRHKISETNFEEIFIIAENNTSYENFVKKFFKNPDINIKKTSLSAELLNSKNKLIVIFEDLENQSQKFQTVKNYAKQHNLKPKTFDLLNIKKSYNILNSITEHKKLTLDEQQKNLANFIQDYNAELKNFIINPNEKSKLSKHFYDKASTVVLACNTDKSICEDFGNFNFEKSLKSSLIQNLQQATEKHPNYEKKIYLLTKFEKQNFNNEEEFLNSLDTSLGVFIKIGLRQAIMLPFFWEQYNKKQEFINELKIKSGLNPDYWNDDINIYYFKAVEV